MGQIKTEYGDLLQTDAKYIAHCVNAQGKMRSGVAKAIREKYPKAYDVYMKAYNEDRLKLGNVIGANCGDKVILNIVGQQNYGYDGALYVSYTALRSAFNLINKNIKEPIAMPMIGCGLAGGDYRIIFDIIEDEIDEPIVYILDDKVPF